MKARLVELVAALRRKGVVVSVAEAIDGAAAMSVAGVDRAVLQDGLRAALVKREADRPLFDEVFGRVFPARPAPPMGGGAKRRRPRAAEPGGEGGGGGGAAGAGGHRGGGQTAGSEGSRDRRSPRARDTPEADRAPRERGARRDLPSGAPADGADATAGRDAAGADRLDARRADAERAVAGSARERALLALPFRAMSPRDVEEAAALTRTLARRFRGRLARRLRRQARGRLDFRRTIRASIAHGGVPIDRRFRGRRRDRPALTALCDLSASTATASDFFLSLLAPAADYFSRVRLFGFVDRLVEIEFVDGQVRPAGPIDLMARSDFGRVLRDLVEHAEDALTADTLLLVLGDARNNRKAPRADLLAAARTRVRRLFWLDPEPLDRWNTGDSVIASYARHADLVLPCGTLGELDGALAAICRGP